jgi:tRNA-splicing ligase RtcB
MSELSQVKLEKIDDFRWKIPMSFKPGMRVPGIIYADEKLLKDIYKDKALEQVANVAFLPGIVNASLGMPDLHWGYGFPIGGVAATDIEEGGVVSPGGVGFDINCGVRLLKTNFQFEDIQDKIQELVYALFSDIPTGVGSEGDIKVSAKEERQLLVKGAQWAVEKGMGTQSDLECTEESGAIAGADPNAVSERAYQRGKAQSGTLGSGNHFLEVQVIDQLFDSALCDEFGLNPGQVMVMIHSGSRGLGYQICDEAVKNMAQCLTKYNINVPDRQLACAPVKSAEGQQYLAAMRCAANYAWANRQCLMHLTRKVFERVFNMSWKKMGMELIYDVAHNIAKIEKYNINNKEKLLCVHRKGATRAFGPHSPGLPQKYLKTGQPVIIPGDMGRNSYLLVGTKNAMDETFGSTCHGAGRLKSRTAAVKSIKLDTLLKDLESKGIIVKASGRGTIVEEAPQAYKDINDVVSVVHNAGLSKRVCRMRPVGVIKG